MNFPDSSSSERYGISRRHLLPTGHLAKSTADGYQSNLPSVTDFPLSLATHKAFTEPDNWTDGMARLYLILSQDFLYPYPFTKCDFP